MAASGLGRMPADWGLEVDASAASPELNLQQLIAGRDMARALLVLEKKGELERLMRKWD